MKNKIYLGLFSRFYIIRSVHLSIIFILRFSLISLIMLSACGQLPEEKAIVGKWISSTDSRIFEFFSNGSFAITDPGGQRLAGTYRVLESSGDLSDAQFILNGGYNIRFTDTGDAFYIYIDGASGADLFRRANRIVPDTP